MKEETINLEAYSVNFLKDFLTLYQHIRQGDITIEDIKQYVNRGARGLGDTVEKFTHATKIDKLAEAYNRITGKPCGCKERQELLNKMFPYESNKEAPK